MSTPTTTKTDAVEATKDLLEQSVAGDWRNGKPDRIGFLWEYNQNDRRNYPKPSLYIWSPISATHEKFSINGESRLKNTETEIIISTQSEIKTREYAEDTVDFFDDYYADNESNTTFYEFGPTEVADLLNENIPRQSQNYYATVTLEGRALKDT